MNNDFSKLWTDDETLCLLDIWGSKEMQDKMANTKRNRLLWEDIAKIMGRRGYQRSSKQCGGKIHNMKVEYRKVKFHGTKPHHAVKFYEVMDAIMSSNREFRTVNGADNFDNASLNLKYETEHLDNDSLDEFYDEDDEIGETETRSSQTKEETVNSRLQMASRFLSSDANCETLNSKSTQNQELPVIADICHVTSAKRCNEEDSFERNLHKKLLLSTPECSIDPNYDVLATVLDKMREMQKQSDERYYAWEEKRLRIEREFEERRQQREIEREAKRDEFFIKMATVLTGQQQKLVENQVNGQKI